MKLINENNLFLLSEIVKKNFASKYKDSVLGIFWTILNPLLMMALFTIIFSTLFSRNIDNFPVYFLCGWCLFHFFTASVGSSMTVLKRNKNILQKTPAPKYIFVLGAIIAEFLNLLIMFGLLLCIIIITHAPIYWSLIPLSLIPVASLICIVTGLGLMFSIICVYYSDVQHLWGVLSMMLMYASAIFYPMTMVPEPFYSYLILNPLYWVINQFRCFIYHGIVPEIGYIINLVLISLIILVIGIIIFKKYESKVTMQF